MAIEDTIEAALFSFLAELDLNGVPIAWPGKPFDPTSPYVRVQNLRNNNTRLFMKGTAPHLRQGILQLTVVAPINQGSSAGLALATVLAGAFSADLSLYDDDVRVRVQRDPDIATAELTDKSWDTRVDVYYESLS